MKIIFLDIDGVLNNGTDTSEKTLMGKIPKLNNKGEEIPRGKFVGKFGIDPDHVAVLNKIVDQTGAVVVVSSTWRLDYEYSATNLQKALEKSGFIGKVIDTTKNEGKIRGDQIHAWLERNSSNVESFVIIDDSSDMGPFISRLVRTAWMEGLKDSHIPKALGILGIPFDIDEVLNAR